MSRIDQPETNAVDRPKGAVLDWLQRRYRGLLSRLYRPPLRLPLSLLYRGDKVECPVCGGRFRSFVPIVAASGGQSVRTRCPSCGARDRNRNLWLYLKNKTNLFTDQLRVLHFAPERIFEKRLKAQPNLHYVSTDLQRPQAMVHADITQLPFADGSFDVIICSHVLEHVVEDRQAMRELYRVLKHDGWALVLVPISSRRAETYEDATVVAPEDREREFGQYDHVRIYGRDFKERLVDAGFTVSVVDLRRELGEERAQRYGLRQRSPHLHVCSKSPGTPSYASAPG